MKINGISPNKIVNLYSDNKKISQARREVIQKDSIEISSVGKSLSSYSLDDKFINSKEKIESIRNEVKSGTYKRDSKLVAAKILDAMKGKL